MKGHIILLAADKVGKHYQRKRERELRRREKERQKNDKAIKRSRSTQTKRERRQSSMRSWSARTPLENILRVLRSRTEVVTASRSTQNVEAAEGGRSKSEIMDDIFDAYEMFGRIRSKAILLCLYCVSFVVHSYLGILGVVANAQGDCISLVTVYLMTAGFFNVTCVLVKVMLLKRDDVTQMVIGGQLLINLALTIFGFIALVSVAGANSNDDCQPLPLWSAVIYVSLLGLFYAVLVFLAMLALSVFCCCSLAYCMCAMCCQ